MSLVGADTFGAVPSPLRTNPPDAFGGTMSVTTVSLPSTALKGSVLAVDLVAALKSVLPMASTDLTIPVLNQVHLSAGSGKLSVMTTDRYCAGKFTVDYDGEPMTLTIQTRDVAAILAAVKSVSKNKAAPAELVADGNRLTVKTWDSEATITTGDAADFPKLDSIWPSKDKAGLPSGNVCYSPAILAKFAKVVGDSRNDPMRMWVSERESAPDSMSKGKPVVNPMPTLITIGSRFVGLIMPMRNDRADRDY